MNLISEGTKRPREKLTVFFSIRALEGLIFGVPGPAGSLKDALDALNALVRIGRTQSITEHLLTIHPRDRSKNSRTQHAP